MKQYMEIKSEMNSNMKREGLKMYQDKSTENKSSGERGGPQTQVAQNVLKHILVWNFWNLSKFLKFDNFCNCPPTTNPPSVTS